ncbi:MAG: M48 family metalloprotease [Alphaproteobacteria bacterium]|nr:M48 family metalloprotease [Alphaproteobacteria bacterium]
MKKIAFCSVALLLASCATPSTISPEGNAAEIEQEAYVQNELALSRGLEENRRIQDTAYPILIANAELCSERGYSTGLSFANAGSIDKKFREAAQSKFGIGKNAQVIGVTKNSPAAKAGIAVGDMILAVGGTTIPGGPRAIKAIDKAVKAEQTPDLTMSFERKGKRFSKTVHRADICDYGVIYDLNSPEINAYADGKNIIITRGMLRFTETDTELALVISHEIAHNAMEHSDKKNQNAAVAGIAGLALEVLVAAAGGQPDGSLTRDAMNVGAGAYSVSFEREADYVGMYFMERAGYKTDGVANFWRRMASEIDSGAIKNGGSHPSSPERFLTIDKTYKEIKNKKAAGLPLMPEVKTR